MMPATTSFDDVTLAVLAGGQGSRMGRAKGTLGIAGKPILSHLLERIDWPGPTLLVTAPGREHPPGHDKFDREVPDPVADEGPLRGVHTALQNATTDIVVIIAVDMPAMTLPPLRWLIAFLNVNSDAQGVMTGRTIEGQIQPEPFPSAFRRSAIPLLERRIASGRRSVVGLIDPPRIVCPPAPQDWPDIIWTNLNNPSDLKSFEESLRA